MPDTNDYATRLAAAEAAVREANETEAAADRALWAAHHASPEHAARARAQEAQLAATRRLWDVQKASPEAHASAIALLTAAGYTVTPPKETP